MPAQRGAPDSEAISGFVEVFADAEIFTTPKADAPRFRLASYPGDEPRRAHPRGVIFLPVKKDHGTFIEVGLSPVPDGMNVDMGCGELSLELLGDKSDLTIDVGLFVRRADLAAVIAKPFAKRWDDGTSVELEPGALVAPVSGGLVAELDGLMRRLEGDATIAHSFPAAPKEREGAPAKVTLYGLDDLTLGGASLPRPGWLIAPSASDAKKSGDRVLFPLVGRCHRVVVSAPASAVRPYEPKERALGGMGLGLGGLGTIGDAPVWVMPKGTSLDCSVGGVHAKIERDRTLGEERKDLCVSLSLAATSRYVFVDHPESHDAKVSCCAKASRAVQRKPKAPPRSNRSLRGTPR